MSAVFPQDPTFLFERSLQESIADECYEVVDLGPTDRLPPDLLELEYRLFFGSDSPLSSPSTSPSTSRSASPRPSSKPAALSSATPGASNAPRKPQNSDRRRNRARLHTHRAKKRAADREAARARPVAIDQDMFDKCVGPAKPAPTLFDAKNIPTASTGFIALPDHGEPRKTHSLKKLVADFGFKVEKWDGRTPRPITDASERIVAVLAGHPNASDWDDVQQAAADLIEKSRSECHFPVKATSHRRGDFPALNFGISHGGGQMAPGNLCHNAKNTRVLSNLIESKAISRMAGYANKAFAMWAPNLFTYYETHFDKLLDHDPTLRRNWPNNVWASFAVNFH